MDDLHCFTFHFGEKRVEATADSLIPLHSKMRHFILLSRSVLIE